MAKPDDVPPVDDVLEAVGPRLRALRADRDLTLAAVSRSTGISVSTLSRLESGQRKPTRELLLPLARAYQVALDEVVDTPAAGDPDRRAPGLQADVPATVAQRAHGPEDP